jgi:hypothetical protein
MSLELHEWDIHIVCPGADDAHVTGVSFWLGRRPAAAAKLTGST